MSVTPGKDVQRVKLFLGQMSKGYFVVGTDVHFLALGEISAGTNSRSPFVEILYHIEYTLVYKLVFRLSIWNIFRN